MIGLLTEIAQVAVAIGLIAGLLTILYKTYWSPAAKARRQAVEDGKQAANDLDASGVTAAFDKLRGRQRK